MKKTRLLEIGENHRRGIATTLTLLDEALCEFEQWARGREGRSVLYRERNALSPAQRKRLLSEVAETRSILRKARDVLGLEATLQTAAQAIWARCSSFREHLIELEAKHLRRYGPLPPGLSQYMDPLVPELLRRLDGIADVVRSGASQAEGDHPTHEAPRRDRGG